VPTPCGVADDAPTVDLDPISFARGILSSHAGRVDGRCGTCDAAKPCRPNVAARSLLREVGELP